MSIAIDVTKISIATLPDKMLEYAAEVLLKQAELMVGFAQCYVPVETGALRDSIRVEHGSDGIGTREVKVLAGGYFINPKTGKLVDYAGIVEARSPYMRPAFDQIAPTIKDMLQAGVIEKMNSTESGVVPI
jgi:hypothetical protein